MSQHTTPSTTEMHTLASHVYDPSVALGDGWETEGEVIITDNGLRMQAYKNGNQVVIAYAGSNDKLVQDYQTAARMVSAQDLGYPDQMRDAVIETDKLVNKIINEYQGTNITFTTTGHSLGGIHAQVTTNTYGFDGVTFDAPGAQATITKEDYLRQLEALGIIPQGAHANFNNITEKGSFISWLGTGHIGSEEVVDNVADTAQAAGIVSLLAGATGLGILFNVFNVFLQHRLKNFSSDDPDTAPNITFINDIINDGIKGYLIDNKNALDEALAGLSISGDVDIATATSALFADADWQTYMQDTYGLTPARLNTIVTVYEQENKATLANQAAAKLSTTDYLSAQRAFDNTTDPELKILLADNGKRYVAGLDGQTLIEVGSEGAHQIPSDWANKLIRERANQPDDTSSKDWDILGTITGWFSTLNDWVATLGHSGSGGGGGGGDNNDSSRGFNSNVWTDGSGNIVTDSDGDPISNGQRANNNNDYTDYSYYPIVLDLDNDGIELTSLENSSTLYDIYADGYAYKIAWTQGDDGFLAFDFNNDGAISQRGELSFVDYIEGAQTDLEGLAYFDTNNNHQLDAGDARWGAFGVWRDINNNGITDLGEYKSLDDMGITSISLSSDNQQHTIADNTIYGIGQYTMADGSSSDFADVALRKANSGLKVADDGSYTVRSRLNEKFWFDQNAQSANIISANTEYTNWHGLDQNDSIHITHDQDVILDGGEGNDTLRGGSGNDTLKGSSGSDSLYGGAGHDLLLVDAHDQTISGGEGIDTAIFTSADADITVNLHTSSIEIAHTQGGNDTIQASGKQANVTVYAGAGNDQATGGAGNDGLYGEAGDDTLHGGEGDDQLLGGDGDDTLQGGSGDDYLHGGQGNDHLQGGAGNDTYYWGLGDGDDVITNHNTYAANGLAHSNTLILGAGILPEYVSWQSHGNDLKLTVTQPDGSQQSLTFSGWLNTDASAANTLQNIVFADGQTINLNTLNWAAVSSTGNDTLIDANHGNVLDGLAGHDTLHGNGGDDHVFGREGDDQLLGGAGNDVLVGGAGNTLWYCASSNNTLHNNKPPYLSLKQAA